LTAGRYIGNDMGNFGGTVFTEHVHFKNVIGIRAPRLHPPHARVVYHDIIINGIASAYPLAFGHFLHEALPRVIVMARLYAMPHFPQCFYVTSCANPFQQCIFVTFCACTHTRLFCWR
jgi:hypothetical protein